MGWGTSAKGSQDFCFKAFSSKPPRAGGAFSEGSASHTRDPARLTPAGLSERLCWGTGTTAGGGGGVAMGAPLIRGSRMCSWKEGRGPVHPACCGLFLTHQTSPYPGRQRKGTKAGPCPLHSLNPELPSSHSQLRISFSFPGGLALTLLPQP